MLGKIEEENKTLKAEIAKECEEHQQFCETAKKKVDDQQSKHKKSEIETLAKAKTATAKGGKK